MGSRPLIRRPRLLQAAVLVPLLTVALWGCRNTTPTPRAEESPEDGIVPVAAEAARVGTLRATIHASAVVVPADGAEFLAVAPEPARVVDVTRNEGDPVASGDVLVRFELTTASQEVSRQQAEVARAQAQLENVRASHGRTSDLVGRGMLPRNELAQAERELAEAQAALAAAERLLLRAQDALARGTLRAPFAGIVVNRLHNPGDLANATTADPVLRVVDPTRLEVSASIPGADVSRVLPGASARVAGFIDGREVALVVAGRPTGTPDAQGNLRVRLTFREPATVMVDAPIEVDIDAEERQNVVFVPPAALVAQPPNAALFVVVEGTAVRRPVTTGVTSSLGVEITSGLAAGELVITRGQANVKDGEAVSAEVSR